MNLGLVLFEAAEGEYQNPLIPADYDIIWSAVIFVVIFVFFWRVALPRMRKLLDERSAKIEGNIESAQAAQKEANAALERYNAQLADARSEAGRIRDQAREEAKRIVAEAREQASAEAERIGAQADARIEADRQTAIQELRRDVGSLALELASGIVGQHLDDDRNANAYVDRFLKDLDLDAVDGAATRAGSTR